VITTNRERIIDNEVALIRKLADDLERGRPAFRTTLAGIVHHAQVLQELMGYDRPTSEMIGRVE